MSWASRTVPAMGNSRATGVADGTEVTAAGAAELLRPTADIVLFAHVTPDADALGSALALGMGLRRLGKRVVVSFGSPAELPSSLAHLDTAGLVVPASDVPAAPETVVALDTASTGRLGGLADRVDATRAAGGTVLVLDHHVSNTRYGTHHCVDAGAEATAVVVTRVLDALGVPLTEPIASCLYAGLATDTGSFARATGETHRLAARLLDAGVRPEPVLRPIVADHPFGWLRMLSAVLGGAVLEPEQAGGKGLVHALVSTSDSEGLRSEEVESVVDILRATAEAEVACVLKQVGPVTWNGSLRALGALDVSVAARELGGGGHTLASGFTAHGSPDEVLVALRAALNRAPTV